MNRRGTGMALLVKFIMTFVIAWIAFALFDNNSFGWILTLAIAGTLLNYIIGDLFVLPTFGNITATIGDGILAAFTAYVLSAFAYTPYSATTGTALVVFGVLIAVGEYFFHRYLINSETVEPGNVMNSRREPDFSVEAGEEFDFNNQFVGERDSKTFERNNSNIENNDTVENDIINTGVHNTYNMDFNSPEITEKNNENNDNDKKINNYYNMGFGSIETTENDNRNDNKNDDKKVNNYYNMGFGSPEPAEFENDNDKDSSDYK